MKPWLWLPPRLAHDLSPFALGALGAVSGPRIPEWSPLEWRGLHFPNRLGIAGGVDKSGATVRGWWALGAGFVEVGTVTPQPQKPNPGVIMGRDLPSRAIWNKMGFPGEGSARVAKRLARLTDPRPTPVFVNVGKNRQTPNEFAARDYAACVRALRDVADAFVINISSPNTQGLRELQGAAYLREFLRQIVAARDADLPPGREPLPLLLKLSPDLDDSAMMEAVDVALERGVDGFIATNTTSARGPGSPFPAEGGVSGAPLADRSKRALRTILSALGDRRPGKLVISVGGVMSPEDVLERLAMGADLVQVYSALILEGPGFFGRVAAAHASRSTRPTPRA